MCVCVCVRAQKPSSSFASAVVGVGVGVFVGAKLLASERSEAKQVSVVVVALGAGET